MLIEFILDFKFVRNVFLKVDLLYY